MSVFLHVGLASWSTAKTNQDLTVQQRQAQRLKIILIHSQKHPADITQMVQQEDQRSQTTTALTIASIY